jgi:hypothetical protein|tara:strand:+ start:941 stop:1375 length:435 start_codon:yes stop_codon:yes gene_type:complete
MVNKTSLYVFEILEKVSKLQAKQDQIKLLREHQYSWALKDILKGSFDDSIVWNFPPGAPPYDPAAAESHPTNLTQHNKKFRNFVKGGPGDKLMAIKREKMFLDIIETVHPRDAELMIGMINKNLNITGITKELVQEAFPGLIVR